MELVWSVWNYWKGLGSARSLVHCPCEPNPWLTQCLILQAAAHPVPVFPVVHPCKPMFPGLYSLPRTECAANPWSVFPEPAVPADCSSLTMISLQSRRLAEIRHTLRKLCDMSYRSVIEAAASRIRSMVISLTASWLMRMWFVKRSAAAVAWPLRMASSISACSR